MKILLLSQIPPVFELKRKANEAFPSFQAQTFWIRGLEALGHTVYSYNYANSLILPSKTQAKLSLQLAKMHHHYRAQRNKFYFFQPDNWVRTADLNGYIKHIKPDVIIVSGGLSHFSPTVLSNARQMGAKIFLLHGEDPLQSATYFEKDSIHLFDWIIANDPSHESGWKKLGVRNVKAVPYAGIDPSVHRKIKLSEKKLKSLSSDVLFVGGLSLDRQKMLESAIDLKINLKIYGPKTNLSPKLEKYYCGEAWGSRMVDLFNAAKIVLNFVPPHMPLGGNMRTFEIPGSGAFQLANRCPKEWFVPNKEIVLFDGEKDLQEKIRYYLENHAQRKAIAQAGYNRTQREYTYEKRFGEMLELVQTIK